MNGPARRVRPDKSNSIEYSYDAAGSKVQELVRQTGQADKVTDYINGYVYENNVLQYALTPEGRAVYNTTDQSFKEEYFVKDHLGNVRSTIDITTYGLQLYLATYEIASANLEGLLFEQLNEIRDDKPNATNPQDVKSGRLNGTDPDRRTGTSLLMHVMSGDQVEISVNNFYENYDKDQDNPVSAGDMLESIVSTLTGGTGGLGGGESHNPDMVQQLFGPDNYMNVYEEIAGTATDPSKPRAYLNYILFDENMQVQTEFSKAVQVNGNGSWQTIGTNGAVLIPVNGYLAVYLSTRSQTAACVPCSDIYFDQLQIKVQKGNLLEETHYYPFGLPMFAMSTDAVNNTKANRHKYQGNEYIKDLGLNWMDFHARQYDPQLGRFLGVDPLADQGGQETLSPYAAMGNAPESMVDPNGEQFGPSTPNIIPRDYGNAVDPNGDISEDLLRMMNDPMGGTGSSAGGSWITAGFDFGSGASLRTIEIQKKRAEAIAIRMAIGELFGNGRIATNLSAQPMAGADGVVTIYAKKPSRIRKAWRNIKKSVSSWVRRKTTAANNAAENAVSSVVLVGSSIVMPIINQVKIISREGIHEGHAYNPDNRVSWAVSYSVEDWNIVRRDELNAKESLTWEEGKEAIQATNNVLLLITPIKYNIPGFNPLLLNKGAEFGTKYYIKKGVKYSLGDDE